MPPVRFPRLTSRALSSLTALVALVACDAHAPTPPPPAPIEPPPHVAAPIDSAPAPTASELASAAPAPPPSPPVELRPGGSRAVKGEGGLVTSVEPNATHIGTSVLKRGGNAIDAAVAVAFALAVTHPSAGNIGGGGFMVIRLANGDVHAIDFRETAPANATIEKNRQQLAAGAGGYLSAPVPGTVAGLALARDKYGTRPLDELVKPAIELAKKGHKLGARQAQVLGWSWEKLKRDPAARAIFGKRGKQPYQEGELWKQPDLARTLEAIAKNGAKGFYEGPVAEKIAKAMSAHGGLVSEADLKAYVAKERSPIHFEYRGLAIDTMPPPSMGGIAFASIVKELERARAWTTEVDTGASLHVLVESMRRAYAERRLAGADPDFMGAGVADRLVAELLSAPHLAARKPAIDPEKATPSSEITATLDPSTPAESPETTHFSIVDGAGNAVSCTYTLSASFGAKIVVPGTGVLFSNAMGGFSESGPNALAPNKRMASSMTPTIVAQDGKLALVLGSPGGDTIPNTVAQVFRNLVDYGMTIDEAVAHARIHHQWHPDKIRYEKRNPPPKAALDDLVRRGHALDAVGTPMGDANDILFDASAGVAWGVADGREGGLAEGLGKPKP